MIKTLVILAGAIALTSSAAQAGPRYEWRYGAGPRATFALVPVIEKGERAPYALTGHQDKKLAVHYSGLRGSPVPSWTR